MTYLIVLLVLITVAIVVHKIGTRMEKATATTYLSKHPDAATIFLMHKLGFVEYVVEVHSLNGEEVYNYAKGVKRWIYAPPGNCIVNMSCIRTRPGYLKTKVITSTEIIQKTFVVEPYKQYIILYDKKTKVYSFQEYEK